MRRILRSDDHRSAFTVILSRSVSVAKLVALAVLLILFPALLNGQSYLENVGVPTFTTSIPVENGFIDGGSGNLHLEIQLGSFPQRGGRQYRVALVYDSAIWLPVSGSWQPNNVSTADGSANSWGGWRLVTSGDIGIVHPSSPATGCYGPFIWTAPDGTQHAFSITTAQAINSCSMADTPTGNAFASDATGYHMYVSNYTQSIIKAPDGTKVYDDTSTSAQRLEDSNGNYYYLSSGTITDTAGRVPVSTSVNGSTITYTLPNAQGTNSAFTVVTTSVGVSTSFGQTGITEYSGAITVIDHIVLPDGTSYHFGYDSGFGIINSMTLPTGASISYSFTTFPDAYGNKYRWISGRTTPDGSWSYSPSATSCGQNYNCEQQVTVGKPNQDEVIYTFFLNGGPWNGRIQYYGGPGASKLLATIIQCFNFVSIQSNGQCTYNLTTIQASGVWRSAVTTLLPIPGSTVSKTTEYAFDSNSGNLNQKSEWNFYSGNLPATADRSTCITYLNGGSYSTNNILNHPLSITVVNNWSATPCVSIPTANIVAQTTYCYDYTGPGCSGGSFGNATGVNHDLSYGASYTARGDITQTQRLISGSSYLTTSGAYDITGQLVSSTDSKGNVTTFGYSDNFFTDSGNNSNPAAYTPANPTNAYVTSVTQGQGSLISNIGYYYGTGQQATVKDPNGNFTYSHFFDLLNRPTATSIPNGPWSLTQYNSTDTQIDTYTGITASAPTTGCTGTSGGCRHDQTLLDSSGRVVSQILASDPDGQSRVDTPYDQNGRVLKTSNPYRSTSDSTYGWETPTYDGLDRVTQMLHADGDHANTYYGVDVGLIGGRTSPSSGLGYPVATLDETGKVKQVWVDGFGRTIESDEPTSGNAYVAGTSGSGFVTISGSEQSVSNPSPGSQGPNSPTTATNVGTGTAWLTPSYAQSYDGVYTTASLAGNGGASKLLVLGGYGFNIPSTATITGIAVVAYVKASSSGYIRDTTVKLMKAGVAVGSNRANGAYWSNIAGTQSYGGSGDLWGTTWTYADINDPNGIGVEYSVLNNAVISETASIDYIYITVYYTTPLITYDSGTVSITVNGQQISTNYGATDNPNSIASNLAANINGGSSYVTASASGANVNLTSNTTGAATNYTLSSSSSTNLPGTFSVSFTATASGAALTGGIDGTQSPLANGAVTTYTYDLNNNLTVVTAAGGTQTRSYRYDELSRLTQKTEPETGTTYYCYTALSIGSACTGGSPTGTRCSGDSSAICARTDALNTTTYYGYDTLNRPTSKTYSDSTPAVNYYYDQTSYNGLTITNGKGRRTGMSDASGQTAWSFDSVGNVKTEARTIIGKTKTIGYTYNLDGSIASITYPGGRTVTYTVGNAQRPIAATDTANGINYASASSLAMYAPTGAAASIVYGYVSGGGITETRSYNNRLELTGIQAVAAGAGTILDLAYSYTQSIHNNGNIVTQTNNVDTGRTQNYTYDNLNRLLTAQTQAQSGSTCWGQSFGNDASPPTLATDALANLFYTTSTLTNCSSPQPRYTMNSSPYNNQFAAGTGISYDADGDNTADTVNSYNYDAENRIITASVSGVLYCYYYDGNGLRVAKLQEASSCANVSDTGVFYWRNIAGNTIAETGPGGITTNGNYHEYVFFAGRRVARSDVSSATVYYYFVDHLGSTRIMAQANGTVCFSADYYPYGQELNLTATCNPSNTAYKFTGYERDAETGLDYAFARYYNSRLGRFMSGDPIGGDSGDPQSLNRYAYARNNPINLVDPLGMDGEGLPRTPPIIVNAFGLLNELFGGFGFFGLGGRPAQNRRDYDDFRGRFDPPRRLRGGTTTSAPATPITPPDSDPVTPNNPPSQPSSQASVCVNPNFVEKAGIKIQTWLAQKLNLNVGIGAGGSGGIGHILGVAGSLSRQMVVSPNGRAALVTSFAATPPPFGVVEGGGVFGGLQFSLGSPSSSPNELANPAVIASLGGGSGWGGGLDLAYGSGGWQGTVTLGAGAGLEGSGGAALVAPPPTVTPICTP